MCSSEAASDSKRRSRPRQGTATHLQQGHQCELDLAPFPESSLPAGVGEKEWAESEVERGGVGGKKREDCQVPTEDLGCSETAWQHPITPGGSWLRIKREVRGHNARSGTQAQNGKRFGFKFCHCREAASEYEKWGGGRTQDRRKGWSRRCSWASRLGKTPKLEVGRQTGSEDAMGSMALTRAKFWLWRELVQKLTKESGLLKAHPWDTLGKHKNYLSGASLAKEQIRYTLESIFPAEMDNLSVLWDERGDQSSCL